MSKGRQKIEMKLVESKDARYVTFSKRKLSLFKKANEFSTLTGADVGILLISPSGKPYSYGSTSIEKITDKFLEWKLENPHVVDQADGGKTNVFRVFDDLREELQIMNEKEKSRKIRNKILHPNLETSPDKHRLEKLVELKLRLENIKMEAKNNILAEPFKFDMNVVPNQDEGESSGTQ
ncbi:agamous-like MADS-box protein AGL29 [Solanum dulcamara]|uniref:agamous-like MADS-box protein AGL29 n=1 Tax=Solanum dulcamara TaxID=45834 RepID=UPI002486B263|nr:agamous-like MADS-box protein AGL29 [Solanum dulcamara]